MNKFRELFTENTNTDTAIEERLLRTMPKIFKKVGAEMKDVPGFEKQEVNKSGAIIYTYRNARRAQEAFETQANELKTYFDGAFVQGNTVVGKVKAKYWDEDRYDFK